jgi:type II secretory pathway pseudopilin PulG
MTVLEVVFLILAILAAIGVTVFIAAMGLGIAEQTARQFRDDEEDW